MIRFRFEHGGILTCRSGNFEVDGGNVIRVDCDCPLVTWLVVCWLRFWLPFFRPSGESRFVFGVVFRGQRADSRKGAGCTPSPPRHYVCWIFSLKTWNRSVQASQYMWHLSQIPPTTPRATWFWRALLLFLRASCFDYLLKAVRRPKTDMWLWRSGF